jgi:hypothetical protein
MGVCLLVVKNPTGFYYFIRSLVKGELVFARLHAPRPVPVQLEGQPQIKFKPATGNLRCPPRRLAERRGQKPAAFDSRLSRYIVSLLVWGFIDR